MYSITVNGQEVGTARTKEKACARVNELALDMTMSAESASLKAIDYKGVVVGHLYYDGWNINNLTNYGKPRW